MRKDDTLTTLPYFLLLLLPPLLLTQTLEDGVSTAFGNISKRSLYLDVFALTEGFSTVLGYSLRCYACKFADTPSSVDDAVFFAYFAPCPTLQFMLASHDLFARVMSRKRLPG